MIDVLVLSASSLFLSPSDSVSWESDARVGTCVEVDLESAAAGAAPPCSLGIGEIAFGSQSISPSPPKLGPTTGTGRRQPPDWSRSESAAPPAV
jgi:hypothetical protein